MSVNVSGLNGRNVMFWKWCVPIKAYIVKYTKEGKYYALSKRSGKLYEFSQFTGEDTDGAKSEVIRIKQVPYSALDEFNIKIQKENWKEFIDFNCKNDRWELGDTLDLIRDILRIGSIGTLLLGGTLVRILSIFGITFNFGYIGISASIIGTLSLFIGRADFTPIDNELRARKSYEQLYKSK